MLQLTLWSIPPLLVALIALTQAWRVDQGPRVPGAAALKLLLGTVVFWSCADLASSMLVSLEAKKLAQMFAMIGISLAPLGWLMFAISYAQQVTRLNTKLVNIFSLVPLVGIVLCFTNESHQLMWTAHSLSYVGDYVLMESTFGTWFYINAAYGYGLVIAATAILVFAMVQFRLQRPAIAAALLAPTITLFANLLNISGLSPIPGYDFTTIGFLFAVFLLDRGVFRQGLLNRSPVIRQQVVEQLSDPVIIVNSDADIIDVNTSARETWTEVDDLQDTSISELILNFPAQSLLHAKKNIEVTIDNKAFEVAANKLDAANPDTDIALVFRDVTARRQAESELRMVKSKLELMAHTDALTGMFNRRYFMQRMQEEFERVRRHGSVLSVLIFDLDHFKSINDTFGHNVGDKVLIAIAEVTNQVKRITDVACRFGGEEFALLLPETDKEGALHVASRLRHGIETYDYAHQIQLPRVVTASIGVATVNRAGSMPESILQVADRALYKAKNGGRNMVCYEDPWTNP